MRKVENWVCMRKGEQGPHHHMDLTWAPLTRAHEGSLALGPGRRIRAIWCSLQEYASRVRAPPFTVRMMGKPLARTCADDETSAQTEGKALREVGSSWLCRLPPSWCPHLQRRNSFPLHDRPSARRVSRSWHWAQKQRAPSQPGAQKDGVDTPT